MKNINKFICLAVFPAVAFTTSCNAYGKKVSFLDAYDYAVKNFDSHQVEYIDADYNIKVNNFKINGEVKKSSFDGIIDRDYSNNLSGLNIDYKNYYGLCITSNILSKVQGIYDDYVVSAISTVAGIDLNFDYFMKSGGLSIVLSTKSISNIIELAQSAFNLIPIIGKGFIQSFPEWIKDLLNTHKISPTSTGKGSFEFALTTDSHGYIKSLKLDTNIDYDLAFASYKEIEDEEGGESEYVYDSYTSVKGTLDINATATVNLK